MNNKKHSIVSASPSNNHKDEYMSEMIGDSSEKRWSNSGDKFWPCTSSYDNIPPGVYKPQQSQNIGTYLLEMENVTDDLFELPSKESVEILSEIRRFWTLKDKFDERGYLFKRGILMWGDPGCGKTSIINIVIKNIIEDGGVIVFGTSPDLTSESVQMIRKIEPNRKILCIFEDFETLVDDYGGNEYLSLLDGESQVDNIVFLATTNYPENLDKRLIDRPSRFDLVIQIEMPNAEVRRSYLKQFEPDLNDDELDYWVKISDGLSIAHLKEMVISCSLYGRNVDDVVERLEYMRERKANSADAIEKRTKVGFTTKK